MYFENLFELFSYPFVYRALIVGVLVSICAASLGVIIVLKRYSLIGHGLADVGFAALAIAVVIVWSPMAVAMPIVILASFLIMGISQSKKVNGDIAIGMIATGALSIGVIVTALGSGFNVDVYNYMFGSILAMNDGDVILSLVLYFVVISLFIIFYKPLFMITYDEEYGKALGIPIIRYQFLLSFLTGLTVVIGMRMMGTLLISSLIIFPAIIARRLVKSFKMLIIVSAIISVIAFVIGLLFSFILDLPTGACIVLVNIILLVCSVIYKKIINH